MPKDGLVGPGGGTADAGDKDPVGTDPDTTGTGGDSLVVARAYFTLHASELRGPDWPDGYADYSLFVCDPSLPAADVARIRADIPGATLLAYTNCQDIPLGLHSDNPYYAAMEAAFDSSLGVVDLATGAVVRLQGYAGVPGSGVPHYVLHSTSVEILAAFHRDVTMAAGWDGLYLDQCNLNYPPWRRSGLLAQTSTFDCDGDGLAESLDELVAQYFAGRQQYTRRLREELGAGAVLVGNSGGALGDPQLHGITLEGVGDRFTVANARAILTEQRTVSRSPFTAVLWVTTPESDVPSRDLAAEMGVHYGVIDPTG